MFNEKDKNALKEMLKNHLSLKFESTSAELKITILFDEEEICADSVWLVTLQQDLKNLWD